MIADLACPWTSGRKPRGAASGCRLGSPYWAPTRRCRRAAACEHLAHGGDRAARRGPSLGCGGSRSAGDGRLTSDRRFWLPSDLESTSWMPDSSSTARTPPPRDDGRDLGGRLRNTRDGAVDASTVRDRAAVHGPTCEEVLLGPLDALGSRAAPRAPCVHRRDDRTSRRHTHGAGNEKRRTHLHDLAPRYVISTPRPPGECRTPGLVMRLTCHRGHRYRVRTQASPRGRRRAGPSRGRGAGSPAVRTSKNRKKESLLDWTNDR